MFVDVNFSHYPLRDYHDIMSEVGNVIRDYEKLGKRNKKKDDAHLNKHAMHLIRLYFMGIDILERGEINTYREKEHNLLMAIRNGEYQLTNGNFSPEFYKMVDDLETRFKIAIANSKLPDKPDFEKVSNFVYNANTKWR